MKFPGLFCAVLLVAFASGAGAQEVVRKLPVALQLDVNGHGQVVAVAFMDPPKASVDVHDRMKSIPGQQTALPDVFANAVKQLASGWRFKGRKINGIPVSGRTWAHAELQVVEQPDHTYRMKLLYLRNGPYFYQMDIPAYPPRAMRKRAYAAVIVEALVQPDDSVTDVHVVKIHGNRRAEDGLFRHVVEAAVKQWKGHAERIGERAVATHVRVPIVFSLSSMTRAEYKRLQKRVAHDMQAQGASASPARHFQSGQALALDSPFVKQPSG